MGATNLVDGNQEEKDWGAHDKTNEAEDLENPSNDSYSSAQVSYAHDEVCEQATNHVPILPSTLGEAGHSSFDDEASSLADFTSNDAAAATAGTALPDAEEPGLAHEHGTVLNGAGGCSRPEEAPREPDAAGAAHSLVHRSSPGLDPQTPTEYVNLEQQQQERNLQGSAQPAARPEATSANSRSPLSKKVLTAWRETRKAEIILPCEGVSISEAFKMTFHGPQKKKKDGELQTSTSMEFRKENNFQGAPCEEDFFFRLKDGRGKALIYIERLERAVKIVIWALVDPKFRLLKHEEGKTDLNVEFHARYSESGDWILLNPSPIILQVRSKPHGMTLKEYRKRERDGKVTEQSQDTPRAKKQRLA
ncbi:Hypothetical Protein FCC1311_015312 [Hondaea fermentalgiana]|uniref:Uncharacterized protein n=1 Tax=Hondaea fermentalgiana TaxID=2315210 RepID=A0A2R5GC49_9STRA|nr:Hypothetical Protein FCC1311_015312 [Hondaea fermentalgiana]|eukprot:GBG25314.1 Hypothetical Protein FCC1311_015312 [Hondaea fermentalgiana]